MMITWSLIYLHIRIVSGRSNMFCWAFCAGSEKKLTTKHMFFFFFFMVLFFNVVFSCLYTFWTLRLKYPRRPKGPGMSQQQNDHCKTVRKKTIESYYHILSIWISDIDQKSREKIAELQPTETHCWWSNPPVAPVFWWSNPWFFFRLNEAQLGIGVGVLPVSWHMEGTSTKVGNLGGPLAIGSPEPHSTGKDWE